MTSAGQVQSQTPESTQGLVGNCFPDSSLKTLATNKPYCLAQYTLLLPL